MLRNLFVALIATVTVAGATACATTRTPTRVMTHAQNEAWVLVKIAEGTSFLGKTKYWDLYRCTSEGCTNIHRFKHELKAKK